MILRLLITPVALLLMCFSAAFSQQFEWVQHAGNHGENIACGIATDAEGNSFITGYFDTTIQLGNKVLQNNRTVPGSSSAFIAKFDPFGNLLWAENGIAGEIGMSRGYAVATDRDGNSYMAGYVFDYITFGDKTVGLEGDSDLFVAKYSSSGELLWITTGVASLDFGRDLDIKVDAAGNSYISGGIIAGGLGSGSTYYNASFVGGYVIKLDAKGEMLYKKSLGNAIPYNLELDRSGERFYVTGNMVSSANISGIRFSSAGMTDIFIASYNASSGEVEWAEKFGNSNEELATGIAFDKQGSIYIAGIQKGDLTIQDRTLKSKGGTDIFLAKFTGVGILQWAQNAGSTTEDFISGIALDKSGDPFITGTFSGKAAFGASEHTATSTYGNIYLAHYLPTGALKAFYSLGGTGKQESRHITIDVNNNIFFAGTMAGSSQFGQLAFEANSDELFLAKIKAENLVAEPVPIDLDAVKKVVLPNIITPNGDGLNDVFKTTIPVADRLRKQFIVYNRQGVQVYNNSNYLDNWSATGLTDGAYFYILTVHAENEVNTFKGWVEVIR